MKRSLHYCAMLAGLWLLAITTVYAITDTSMQTLDQSREWRFKVFLDNQEIGYHHFKLQQKGREQLLTIEANFQVKFLFFNAYRYDHRNIESWHGDCLASIQSQTDDNGSTARVSGTRDGKRFVVRTQQGSTELPRCIMSFAYWNPDFLRQSRMLNAQTGEYMDISVTPQGQESITVQGKPVRAYRYQLRGEDISIDLWYSGNKEWLALESSVNGGRKLRYAIE